MRFLIQAMSPVDVFNAAVRDGSAGNKIRRILDHAKPESVYFMARDGMRTCVMVVDLADASQIPSFAEPWFLLFNAKIEFHPVMTPADLGASGLDALGKAWG